MSEYEIVLKRQWDLLKELSLTDKGLTLTEMATKFEVSEKTIKRDLISLTSVFGELREYCEAHGRKRYRFDKQPITFDGVLGRDELFALYVGLKMMEPMRGLDFYEKVQTASEKIKRSLGEKDVELANRIAPFSDEFVQFGRRYKESTCKFINAASRAIADSKVLRIRYRSLHSQSAKTYNVCPYNIVSWRSSIYFIGNCCDDKKMKFWKVDRLFDVQVLANKTFRRDPNFNAASYLKNCVAPYCTNGSVVNAVVRFNGYAARIIAEERPRVVKKYVRESNESILAYMTVEENRAFIRWLLEFGSHAVVMEPESLRKKVVEELNDIKQRYEITKDFRLDIDWYDSENVVDLTLADGIRTSVTASLPQQKADETSPDIAAANEFAREQREAELQRDENFKEVELGPEVAPEFSSQEEFNVRVKDLDLPEDERPKRGRPRKYPEPAPKSALGKVAGAVKALFGGKSDEKAEPEPKKTEKTTDKEAKKRAAAEKREAEKREAERLEKERLEAERREAERIEEEKRKLAEERAARKREADRIRAAKKREALRLERERLEAKKIAAKERREAKKRETDEKREAERLEAERLERERLEAEERAAEEKREAKKRAAAEKREMKKREAERLEKERLEKERLEKERLEKERLKKERLEKERLEAERLEKERLEKERLEKEKLEAETPAPRRRERPRPVTGRDGYRAIKEEIKQAIKGRK